MKRSVERCCQKLGKRNWALHALPPAVEKSFLQEWSDARVFFSCFPWILLCILSLLDVAGGLHWLFCSVMHKSCFHFLCTRANCSCLSVPHSGFTRHRERISNALMVFKSGCIYLFMKCKHPTVVCSTSFKTLLSVCCVVQFRGTCKCSVGQLCCSDDVCLPLKSVRYLVNPAAGAGHKQCVAGREAA